MSKASYDLVAGMFDQITEESIELQVGLSRLVNQDSPLDRRYFREFHEEVRLTCQARLDEMFVANGWTYDEFLSVLDRRILDASVRRAQIEVEPTHGQHH